MTIPLLFFLVNLPYFFYGTQSMPFIFANIFYCRFNFCLINAKAPVNSASHAYYSIQGKGGKKPQIATVLAPYDATSSNQLSLQRGQLVMVRKKTASGWWEGELQVSSVISDECSCCFERIKNLSHVYFMIGCY